MADENFNGWFQNCTLQCIERQIEKGQDQKVILCLNLKLNSNDSQ